jgi:exopolysaccharide biosynthesis protein
VRRLVLAFAVLLASCATPAVYVEPAVQQAPLGGDCCTDRTGTARVSDGVIRTRTIRTGTGDGPWIIHTVRIAPEHLHRVANVLAHDRPADAEPLDGIAARHDAVIAVNGGYFNTTTGTPNGVTVVDGELLVGQQQISTRTTFVEYRTALLFHDDGTPEVAQVTADVRGGYVATPDGDLPDSVVGVVNGGPLLVENGRRNVRQLEEGFEVWSWDRHPRTAAGIAADGTLILVVVEGRYAKSVGVSVVELADVMVWLGAVDAVNLDGGGSSGIAVNGTIIQQGPTPRPVAEAIVVGPVTDG